MNILRDIDPFIIGTRLFGCSPHKIIGQKLITTKEGIIFFGSICLSFILYFVYSTIEVLHNIATSWPFKILVVMRIFLCYIPYITDGIISMIRNDEMERVFHYFHEYDIIARFTKINESAVNTFCRFMTVSLVLCWTIVGYASYQTNGEFIHAISYSVSFIGLSLQIMKFCGINLLLYRRFNHLNQLVMPEEMMLPIPNLLINSNRKIITLDDVWRMHCKLLTATKKINSIYSSQLLFWFAGVFMNILTRIHLISLVVLEEGNIYIVIRDVMCIIGWLMNLFFIIISCYLTSHRANVVTEDVFSYHSAVRRKNFISKNRMEATFYFITEKFHFSAANGLICIELPLFLSIVGTITSYLVILHATVKFPA